MRIREATRADVPAVVALLADDDLGRQRERPDEPLADEYWSAWEAIDSDPNHTLAVLVDEDAGEILGCLQLTLLPHLTFVGGWRAQIESVRISSGRRNQGLGRQLFVWAISEARRRGCHLVQLTTNAQRDEARRFYESLGFDATHQGMKVYLDGDVSGRRPAG